MAQNPPPVIDAGLMIVTQRLTRSDQSHVCQLTMGLISGAGGVPGQTMINTFQTQFNSHLAVNLDNEVTAQAPTGILGDGTNVGLFYQATGATQAGTANFVALPPQVALLVKKLTATAGKKGRGRWYLPWALAQSNVNQAGLINGGTVIADTNAGLSAFLTAMRAANVLPCLVHRVYAGKAVTNLKIGPEITSMVCETYVATQRRRMVRHA